MLDKTLIIIQGTKKIRAFFKEAILNNFIKDPIIQTLNNTLRNHGF